MIMYSLNETLKIFLIAPRLKRSTDDQHVHNTVDLLSESLSSNVVIIEEGSGDIIAIPDDIDPTESSLNAAIDELRKFAESHSSDSVNAACEDLIAKISAVIDAIDSLK